MPEAFEAFAAAKVNLFLHVGARSKSGFHPVCSLMTFADLGDRLLFGRAEGFGFEIAGPFAAGLPTDRTNLVVRARDALLAAAVGDCPPFHLTLVKDLPTEAGLGGGSSDAAATLRLVNATAGLGVAGQVLERIAESLGSDVPACLRGHPVLAEGRGERLSPAPDMPPLDAVLVNPRIASPTALVYEAFDRFGGASIADRPDLPPRFSTVGELAEFLRACRNDLEAPAVGLAAGIGEVLALLRRRPEVLIARLSGSGATCLALCADAVSARHLAAEVTSLRPKWWVRPCRLGSAPQKKGPADPAGPSCGGDR